MLQSGVDKCRTGSCRDRVEHSTRFGPAKPLSSSELYVESVSRSLPLPVLNSPIHRKTVSTINALTSVCNLFVRIETAKAPKLPETKHWLPKVGRRCAKREYKSGLIGTQVTYFLTGVFDDVVLAHIKRQDHLVAAARRPGRESKSIGLSEDKHVVIVANDIQPSLEPVAAKECSQRLRCQISRFRIVNRLPILVIAPGYRAEVVFRLVRIQTVVAPVIPDRQ